jgi:hypothetical protein
MPSPNQNPAVSKAELEIQVRQQIMLSIGLKFEEKEKLLKKLPTLAEEQLHQLTKVFNDESQRKEQMLGDFFAKNPQLFPDFERFSQNHVNHIYHDVEEGEKSAEVKRSEELLQINY